MRYDECRLTADAVVVGVRPDSCVDLEFEPMAACAGCAGTCMWKRLQSQQLSGLPVRGSFRPGDRVTVSLTGERLLLASAVVHGLPLAAIVAGAVLGTLATGTDLGTLAGVAVGIVCALAIFRPARHRIERAMLTGLIVRAGS